MFGKKKIPVGKTQSTEFGRKVGDLADILGKGAIDLADKAAHYSKEYTKQGKKWAGPKLDEASKVYHNVADEAGKRYKDISSEAGKRYHDISDEAISRWEKDLLPRFQAAIDAAKTEAGKDGDLKTKALAVSSATSKALQTPPKTKTKKAGRFLGWTAVLASTAGIGYLIWKRSQPVEDPWAEAYWENIAAEDAAASPLADETVVADPVEAEVALDEAIADETPEDLGTVADEKVAIADEVLEDKIEAPLNEAEAAHQAGLDEDRKN